MQKLIVVCLAAASLSVTSPTAVRVVRASSGEDLYRAIRSNDLARLGSAVRTAADANARVETGDPLLLVAAGVGSVDALKLLLDRGADVNATNAFGATALIWAAADAAKVRLLVDKGADVNAAAKTGRTAAFIAAMSAPSADIVRLLASKGADLKRLDVFGNTMLNAAAVGNDVDTIRLLVEAGVDVNTPNVNGVTPMLTLAWYNNLPAIKLLLTHGAKVNAAAAPALFTIEDPKSGKIALGQYTPLMAAGDPDVVKALLDAGADVNARDMRKMTALMFAVARNHQNRSVIRMLLDHGADPALQSDAGETAADWARKIAAPAGLELLKVSRRPETAATAASPAGDAKAAAERAMALLESSSQKFFETSGCVSCHHQNITDLAAAEARAHGVKVSADAAIARMKMLSAGPPPQLLFERMDIGVPEILGSTLTALAALDVPPNAVTDAAAANIAVTQGVDGSWLVFGGNERPPAEEGRITRTALSIRALTVYGPPGRAPEMKARVAKARQWLESAAPLTAEEHNMRLLGLHWAGADAARLKRIAAPILAAQQADGGWRQREALSSDAYATGQTLYALAKSGVVSPTDAAYRRGVTFLLTTQADNGAWRVSSRAPKFQAYFNSGFPYGGDQWISAWATGWATMALAQAAPAAGTR